MEDVDKSDSLNVSRHLEKVEGNQWGKPGPGGSYWRESALTGQGFYEKMVRNNIQLQLFRFCIEELNGKAKKNAIFVES